MLVKSATTDADIARCFPVMVQLRPHLTSDTFLQKVKKNAAAGFKLAYVEVDDEVRAVAGYRISDNLAWGHFLYVDDLVTDERVRSTGCGGFLFDWLVDQAKQNKCEQFHLDSGVQRFGAHRFYLNKRMDITSHHFALKLQ